MKEVLGIIWCGLVLVAAVGVFIKRKRKARANGNTCTVPGPSGLPFIGQSFDIDFDKAHIYFTNLREKYGDIYSLTLFGKNIVVLGSVEYVKKAFNSEQYSPYMNDRPPSFLGHYVAQNYRDILFRRNDDKFDKVKSICMSAMHNLGNGCPSVCGAVAEELRHVMSRFGTSNGRDVNPMEIINASFYNMTAILFTGERLSETDRIVQCIAEFDEWGNSLVQPKTHSILKTFPFLRHFPGKYKKMYGHIMKGRSEISKLFIKEIRKTYNPERTECLAHALIRAAEEERAAGAEWLTDDFIIGILMDLINTGCLTSRGVMSGFILILAQSQMIQRNIRKEISEVVGSDRIPIVEDIKQMPYTHACILECLRYQSHLPLTAGHSNAKCDVIFDGYFIPKDSVIYANLWSIHHDSRLWESPWEFNPHRFLDSSGQVLPVDDPSRQRFIPFGIGKRDCVGKFMAINRTFLYITSIIQNFNIIPPQHTVLPSTDPRHLVSGTVLQAPQFECRFTQVKTESS